MEKRHIWKLISIIELIIIVALVVFLLKGNKVQDYNDGLLSPRVYSGILPAESKLIFNFDPLENVLKKYIDQKNKTIGVYIVNLRDSASMGINENTGFEPASLNKLLMAILTLREVEKGTLSLETKLQIKATDLDSGSGSLYKTAKESLTVQELLDVMLNESDNTAFHVLGREIKQEDWRALSEYLDYYENIEKNPDFKPNYKVTPVSNSHIFMSLYLSTFLQQQHSEYILKRLTKTSFDINKIANLPEKVTVAQKFGEYYDEDESYFHSCGIMYLEETRMSYCVMTQGMESEEAQQVIGDIVRAIYEYVPYANNNIEDTFSY